MVRDSVDDLCDAVPGAELHLQIVDLEQSAGGRPDPPGPGADCSDTRMSDTGSPLAEFRIEGLADRFTEHHEAQHGGDEERGGEEDKPRCDPDEILTSLIMMPQDTTGDFRPTPRNDRVASAPMNEPTMIVP